MNGGMVSAALLPTSRTASGGREIRQRERQPAVDAERPRPGRRRRGHAEPAVVVDVRGAQRDPGELAQRVRLLVGQAAAAEDRDASGPCADWTRRISAAIRSSASSQLAGTRGAARCARTSGVVSRSAEPSSSADVHPFWHSPPRLVGKSRAPHLQHPPGVAQRHAALQRAVRAMRQDAGHRHTPTLCGSRYPQSSCTLRSRNDHLSAARRPWCDPPPRPAANVELAR